MSVVSVRDLRKEYGALTAVDGVSFEIERGRGVRAARRERGRQVDDGRDPRGPSHAHVGRRERARHRPRPGDARLPRPHRHRPADVRRRARADGPRGGDDLRGVVPRASAGRGGDRAGRPHARSSTSASAPCRAGSAGGSTSPSGSSGGRRCCSSTNRPPGSIRPPAVRRGSSCGRCARGARPCC